ncbi:hypothetical protein EOM81_12650 [bacterium]|nr:hypothetical protein [bacterium]
MEEAVEKIEPEKLDTEKLNNEKLAIEKLALESVDLPAKDAEKTGSFDVIDYVRELFLNSEEQKKLEKQKMVNILG